MWQLFRIVVGNKIAAARRDEIVVYVLDETDDFIRQTGSDVIRVQARKAGIEGG